MTEALGDLQKAVHLSQEFGNDLEIAWAHLHLLRQIVDGHPIDLASAILPSVRAAVAKARSPQAAAYLHMCVAVLEGQNGRLSEAHRHCELSSSLQALSPNVWLDCGNQQNRAAILLAECRFMEARHSLESLRDLASRHGLAHECARADINLGHLQVMLGEHDAAVDTLSRVVGSGQTSRLAALSACEGIARASLYRGDYDRCERELTRIENAAAADSGLASAYGVRWAAITRARLFLALGNPDAALAYLATLESRINGSSDAPLAAAISMTTAEALAACGKLADAARQIVRSTQLEAASFRELQGQFYYAIASTLGPLEANLASVLRKRATRIWQAQGTVWLGHFGSTSGAAVQSQNAHEVAVAAVNSLAGAFELAYDENLLAQELMAAIEITGCAPGSRIDSVIDSSKETNAEVVVLRLGPGSRPTRALVCPVPRDTAKALTLSNILKVGRSVLLLEKLKLEERNRTALWPATTEDEQADALFLSEEMREKVKTARRIAGTEIPVLITGETGTGKEVLARLIHSISRRAKKGFFAFNCASVPREMMDSQLFGHRRGAFTGASENFHGVIRAAGDGTLLLDEIGDMALEVQPKLLRFLELAEVHPLGEPHPTKVDVRVIAATNSDLDVAVSDGRFREDLYYRLNIIHIRLPPLRDRLVEVPTLARYYLEKYSRESQKVDIRLTDEAMERLILFRWPGNIRQLANEMRRLVALAEDGAILGSRDLAPEILKAHGEPPPVRVQSKGNEIVVSLDQPLPKAVRELEKAMLLHAMKTFGGRIEAVANALGLSRKGLYLKRQRYFPDEH